MPLSPTSVLMVFLDGIGLGQPDPAINPVVRARMPHLTDLLGDHQLVLNGGPIDTGICGHHRHWAQALPVHASA